MVDQLVDWMAALTAHSKAAKLAEKKDVNLVDSLVAQLVLKWVEWWAALLAGAMVGQ